MSDSPRDPVGVGGRRGQGTLRDAAADLLLGSHCVGCAIPGRLLCPTCRSALPGHVGRRLPTPTPQGLATPFSAGVYEGTLRAVIVGAKERGQRALLRVMTELLAAAVAGAVDEVVDEGVGEVVDGVLDDERDATVGSDRARRYAGLPVVLVPVPSRPASARTRGLDPLLTATRGAARMLGHAGRFEVVAATLLRTRAGVLDQAGLDAERRRANLAGSMTCPSGGLRRLARRTPWGVVIVCDDVLTTGATAREAQRALEAVGLEVGAIATAAATPRRSIPGRRDVGLCFPDRPD